MSMAAAAAEAQIPINEDEFIRETIVEIEESTVTFKAVRESLKSIGMSIKATGYGDFRVAFQGKGNEDSAYYTSDLRDAYDTALLMDLHKRHAEELNNGNNE